MTAGDITPSEGPKLPKLIDAYLRAYQTDELDERVARLEQLSDAELMRIAMSGRAAETSQLTSLLVLHLR